MKHVILGSTAGREASFRSIWRRRAASVPTYFALASLFLVTAPLWSVMGVALDVATGNGRVLPRTRALAFFGLYLGCEILGIIAASMLWFATAGGRIGGPERYLAANAALQRAWTGALFRGSLILFSMNVRVEGLELARSGPLLLFVRHSSTADTVLAAALVANPNRLLLRYVLKRELLWDPCLDIVGRRLPNAFIDRAGSRAHAEKAAIARLTLNLDASAAVLIYPEGTRFSEPKRASALKALRDKGMDTLAGMAAKHQYVLPPRLGGSLALLEAVPEVDLVLLEHTGLEGASTFSRFWNGALVGQTIQVRLRRFAAADIPKVDRDCWLFERWSEMDRWIAQAMNRNEGTI